MFFEYLTSILLAAVVGGLVGIEREYRDKSAGFRTMILIAVGSSLFTILSVAMGLADGETTRIAAALVTGVGFLGAGAIIKDGSGVKGLTTAASIWLVASLGMGAGAGYYQLVLLVTAVVLLVLWMLPPVERWIDRLHEFLEIHVTIKNTDKAEVKVLEIFDDCNVRVVHVRHTRLTKGERILHIKIKTTPARRLVLSKALVSTKSIITFTD
ncbi:MAG: MgtC/SapB family protein [Candidatus Pacebacteria bacterium]|nr:MgtC/SapB family protein [Candidatus Paceibacterota bacterium]